MTPRLTMESKRVRDRLLAGHRLARRHVQRRALKPVVRFAFEDGDVVTANTVRALVDKGYADLADHVVTARS